MWVKSFLIRIKSAVIVDPGKYEIQNLVLIHMLHITFFLSISSAFANPFFGLPLSVIYGNFIALIFIAFNYWLVRSKHNYKLGRRVYLGFVMFMVNFLWIETGGSSGPSLFCILAFLPLFTFLIDNKHLKLGFTIVGINVLILLLLEAFYPNTITHYKTDLQRILDILLVCIIFIVFEIPLIIYIKNVLISQKNAAKKSEKVKTSFVTHLSHEIRTPMNAILGFTELLNQDDLSTEDRTYYTSIINENGQSLLLLLNNIINIAKIEEERTKISLSEFPAYEVLLRVHNSLAYKTPAEVNFQVLPDKTNHQHIESDVILLYQILSNLTFNALKFTAKGYIFLDLNLSKEKVTFMIKDSGIGISKSKHNSLFSQFEQAESISPMHNFNGSGLGLAICKSLTELLNGRIYFESEKGVGSTFYLELPMRFTK